MSSHDSKMAETGRLLLEGLSIESGDRTRSRMTKRQISLNSIDINGAPDMKVQRVSEKPTIGRVKTSTPKMWNEKEDQVLRAAVKEFGERDWKSVASRVEGRTYLQCMQRWKKALKPGLKKGHWKQEEDQLLIQLIKPFVDQDAISKINWQQIAKEITGRNAKQCRERWFLNLDPSINRGPWTEEEDRLLLAFAEQLECRWSLISKNMPGRTENLVKTRYHALKRQELKNRGWSSKEDKGLLDVVMCFGRDWVKVAKELGTSRTRAQVKKRFNALAKEQSGLLEKVQLVEKQLREGQHPVTLKPSVSSSARMVEPDLMNSNAQHFQLSEPSPINPFLQGSENGTSLDDYRIPQFTKNTRVSAERFVTPGEVNTPVEEMSPQQPHQHQQQLQKSLNRASSSSRSWLDGIAKNLPEPNVLLQQQPQPHAMFSQDSFFEMKQFSTNDSSMSNSQTPMMTRFSDQGFQDHQRSFARSDLSKLGQLDKLLREKTGPDFETSLPLPGLRDDDAKTLRTYNSSFGSMGLSGGSGSDFSNIFSAMSDLASPSLANGQNSDSSDRLSRNSSSLLSSETDIKNFLSLLE